MENLVQKFRGCTRHFCTLERPHQKSFTRFGDGRTARLPDESVCLTKWYGQVKESNVCWAYAWQTFLESLQKFCTTLRSNKKCPCQFSDFSRNMRVFLHLFVSKLRNNYNKWKTWSKNFADAHGIFAHLNDHTKKVSHNLEMVVLHVYQTNQFVAWSDMDKSKRAMSVEHMHDKLFWNHFKNFLQH
jgi:hypothetical protein